MDVNNVNNETPRKSIKNSPPECTEYKQDHRLINFIRYSNHTVFNIFDDESELGDDNDNDGDNDVLPTKTHADRAKSWINKLSEVIKNKELWHMK